MTSLEGQGEEVVHRHHLEGRGHSRASGQMILLDKKNDWLCQLQETIPLSEFIHDNTDEGSFNSKHQNPAYTCYYLH